LIYVLQDTTSSGTIPFNNTLVNIKPDTTLISILRYLSYKIQLHQELFCSIILFSISNRIQLYQYSQVSDLQDTTQSQTILFNNTLVNIKRNMTLSVFPCLYLSFKTQNSGPSRFYTRYIITRTPKTKRSIIPTNVYFEFYGTGYINERNYKFYVIVIDKLS